MHGPYRSIAGGGGQHTPGRPRGGAEAHFLAFQVADVLLDRQLGKRLGRRRFERDGNADLGDKQDQHHAEYDRGMTRARFNALMRETVGVVKRYKQYFEEQNPQASFNPYTVIRHCLYLSNKAVFRPALRNSARESFEAWLQEQQETKTQ